MPAAELRLAGIRPLVPEHKPQRRDIPEAGGTRRAAPAPVALPGRDQEKRRPSSRR
ncbi:hypothetical protein ACWEPC_39765 [Nonomuraea sp. NPDC004297]